MLLSYNSFCRLTLQKEQYYNNIVTQTSGCCLLLAVLSLLLPTAFHASFTDTAVADANVLKLSYATSIVLLLIYALYLFFQLKTHAYLYEETATGIAPSTSSTVDAERGSSENLPTSSNQVSGLGAEVEEAEISVLSALLVLLVSTVLVALCAEFMVSSINNLVATTSISETFVGLIVLPIVGNAAEHLSAVTVAYKNKMNLAIGISVGSSLQIVLFVAPVIVLVGWVIQQPLTLYFSIFETVSVFATVIIVTYLVIDGRSNYLEGSLLMAAYILIAVASWFYPDQRSSSGL